MVHPSLVRSTKSTRHLATSVHELKGRRKTETLRAPRGEDGGPVKAVWCWSCKKEKRPKHMVSLGHRNICKRCHRLRVAARRAAARQTEVPK